MQDQSAEIAKNLLGIWHSDQFDHDLIFVFYDQDQYIFHDRKNPVYSKGKFEILFDQSANEHRITLNPIRQDDPAFELIVFKASPEKLNIEVYGQPFRFEKVMPFS